MKDVVIRKMHPSGYEQCVIATNVHHSNASLIASSPKLLEKLEAWQEVCDRIVEQYGGVVAGVDFGTLGESNRAALSKARGEA